MRIDRTRSLLLMIDLQARLVPVIEQNETLVRDVSWLQRIARRLNVPVLLTEHYRQGLGETLPALRAGIDQEDILQKLTFSAVAESEWLRRVAPERTQFVVTGCESHVCVLQTVLDLLSQRRQVFIVATAVGSRQAADKALALARMQQAGAILVSREMVAYEWLERAGTEVFRSIHKDFLRELP